jgi:uncharacterized repeat protein (TIGR03837 family)
MHPLSTSAGHWDLFCRVVDNYGDAGVCWRIARMLAAEHARAVRLWIDRPLTLRALLPEMEPDSDRQYIDGVWICDSSRLAPRPQATAVVVEAFGCGLPEYYVAAMATLSRPPHWIVLEYLSAEDWVDSHHGLASPHPRLPLQRWFFFPGFGGGNGGLPRERDLLARRDAFDAAACAEFWRGLGFAPPPPGCAVASVFAYPDAPLAALIEAGGAAGPTLLVLPEGAPADAARRQLGIGRGTRSLRHGALELRWLPFLPQRRYDELLWACDINFVRGEDSFVRAQWAARPLVWQPYRQEDGAHARKLAAFAARYVADLPAPAATAWRALQQVWNGSEGAGLAAAWRACRSEHEALSRHARDWAARLAAAPELVAALVEFVRGKVK